MLFPAGNEIGNNIDMDLRICRRVDKKHVVFVLGMTCRFGSGGLQDEMKIFTLLL